MTQDPTLPEPIDAAGLLEKIQAADALLPPAPWELWTSCSYRRIHAERGEILGAYNQRSDNHPDLTMPEEQLQALVDLRNAAPALAAEVVRLRAELEKLKVPDRGFDPAMADSDEEECR